MGVVRGKDFIMAVNEGTYAAPDWTELTNVRDVTRNLTKALADASARLSEYRMQVGTLKELSLDTQVVYDPEDPLFLILQDAFDTDANLDIIDLDGPIDTVGSKGLRFMAQITNFTTGEELENVGLVDVTFVVGYDYANPPHGVEVVTGGAVTPTASSMQRLERARRRTARATREQAPQEEIPAEELAAV